MTNKTYDFLKNLAMVILPALGTFYFSLSQIWGLPYGEEIVGTLSAIAVFIGAVVKISNSNFKKEDFGEILDGYVGEDYSGIIEDSVEGEE